MRSVHWASVRSFHLGLSIDFDHSAAATAGLMSFVPFWFQAIKEIVVRRRIDVCGRNFTMASSKDDIHWSLLYFIRRSLYLNAPGCSDCPIASASSRANA